MGYFSNGTEAMLYEEQWCDRCVHQPVNPDDGGCPILLVHFLYNYGQHDKGKEDLRDAMNILIPVDKETTFCKQCTMFIERV